MFELMKNKTILFAKWWTFQQSKCIDAFPKEIFLHLQNLKFYTICICINNTTRHYKHYFFPTHKKKLSGRTTKKIPLFSSKE